jgi:hypothetical protein
MADQARDAAERVGARQRKEAAQQKAPTAQRVLHPILRLQSQVGNAVVARMLAQREAESVESEDEQNVQGLLQRQGEEEEDEMDAQGLLQRQGEDEAEEEENVQGLLQRQDDESEEEEAVQASSTKVGLEGGPVGADFSDSVQSMRGGGSALPEEQRAPFESAFNTSFEDVRVHTGAESTSLNRSISARAFTSGSDIFLSSGEYQPGTPAGEKVLGHELTHVVQQRSMGATGPMTVGAAGDSYEQEADRVSDAVTNKGDGAAEVARLVGH